MKKLLFLFFVLSLTACSQQKMFSLMSRSPKLDYEKPKGYDDFNDYQKDAIYLSALIEQSYPRLNTKIAEAEFSRQTNELVANLEKVTSSFEFETHLKKYIALLKDGHSKLTSFSISLVNDINYFNWVLLKEKEAWVIKYIDASMDTTLVGHEVTAINDIPIKEIEERVNLFEEGENEYDRFATFETRVYHPKYWKALGVTDNEERISFSVSRNGKVEKHEINAKPELDVYGEKKEELKYPFTRKQNEGYSYEVNDAEDFAYLQMNTSLDYVSFKSEVKNYTNFIIRPFAKLFFKKQKKDARNFGKVLQSLFLEAHAKEINNLIVDLRYNGGGDERTGKQLIWYLTERRDIEGFTDYLQVSDYFKKTAKRDYKIYNNLYKKKYNKALPYKELNLSEEFYNDPYFEDITKNGSPYLLDESIPKFKGKVYVLVGAETFSAGQFLATTIADNDLGVLVGTPVGNMPTTQTGASVSKLPKTKTILGLSYIYVERPDKSKNHETALYPDIEVYQTYEDLVNGKDAAFEKIIEEIKNNER